MLDTHADTDFLEDLWMDDCKCESVHHFPVLECSGEVVARKTVACRRWDFKICANSYYANLKSVRLIPTAPCSECGESISKCWTIRPI